MEASLSLGMPDKIILIWNKSKWIVKLDHENTTFKCQIFQKIEHIQETYPQRIEIESKKKGKKTNHKNWSIPTKSQHIDADEEEQDSIQNTDLKK